MLVVATRNISILGPAREFPGNDLRYLSELFCDLRIPNQWNPAVLQLTRYGELLSVTPSCESQWILDQNDPFRGWCLWRFFSELQNFLRTSQLCETFRIFFNGGLKFLQPHGDGKFEHINHFIKKHWESFILAVNFSCLQISLSG